MVDSITDQLESLSIQDGIISMGETRIPKTILISGSFSYILLMSGYFQELMMLDVPEYNEVMMEYLNNRNSLEVVLHYYYDLMQNGRITPLNFIAIYLYCGWNLNLLISENPEDFQSGQLTILEWKTYLLEHSNRDAILGAYLNEDLLQRLLVCQNTDIFNQPMITLLRILRNMITIDATTMYLYSLEHLLNGLTQILQMTARPRLIADDSNIC